MTVLIISNESMDDITEILKSLQKSCFSIKMLTKLKVKQKNKKVRFLACYEAHLILVY